jgi:hypothetical protein
MNSESMDSPNDFKSESEDDTCSILEVMSTASSEPNSTAGISVKYGGADKEEKKLRAKIIQGDEKAVQWARLIVILVVVAFAFAVSTTVYVFASRGNQQSFKLQVRDDTRWTLHADLTSSHSSFWSSHFSMIASSMTSPHWSIGKSHTTSL